MKNPLQLFKYLWSNFNRYSVGRNESIRQPESLSQYEMDRYERAMRILNGEDSGPHIEALAKEIRREK